jgi:putative phosphoribosyl transferase
MTFVDRADAGRQLARRLTHLRDEPLVVLGLLRGGVPVAYEVAASLRAPLDVIVVRKLGVPYQPELAMGAVGEDGVLVVDKGIVRATGIGVDQFAGVEARQRAEVERRARELRVRRPRVDLEGRTALVVDDGIATGATARAACQVARAHGARRVVLAAPVAPLGWEERLGADADELVCVDTPESFSAIGQCYEHFFQVTDAEVLDCLERARRARSAQEATSPQRLARDEGVAIPAGTVQLSGHLALPVSPIGVVVFAHGSGSSRHSPRNQYVAGVLQHVGIATLLFDLLTEEEERNRANVFDIELLAGRLVEVTRWLHVQPLEEALPIGYFGASTGAGAALWAAAEPGSRVAAVVSRGGRPDLADTRLPRVGAPTLLVVGERDDAVLALNRQAQAKLRCDSRLAVVPGATHLFEEPGALEAAAYAARDWFVAHLVAARAAAS